MDSNGPGSYRVEEAFICIHPCKVRRHQRVHLVLYVQEVVTHFYSKLLYKMGHYFLDTQYYIKWVTTSWTTSITSWTYRTIYCVSRK